jgi:hypothetical protein
MHRITLTWFEQQLAGIVGVIRGADSVRRGARVALFSGDNDEENEIQSSQAEYAVAKALNRHFVGGVNAPELPDVSRMIEVRWTKYSTGHLILREKDCDDRPYVLVCGTSPTFEIVGWMLGADAKQEKWWCNPNNNGWCWYVPQAELHALKDLTGK